MKKILKISIFSFFALMIFSCTDGNDKSKMDVLTGNENVGGLITVKTTNLVYDTQNTTSLLYNVTLNAFQGNVKVQSVDVYKQFTDINGNLSEKKFLKNVPFTTAPQNEDVSFSFSYLDLVDGLSVGGVALPTDDALINIGDKWTLSYVAKRSVGTDVANVGTTQVVAACVSDLGGVYNVVTTRLSSGATYTVAGEVITDFGNATYTTSTTGNFKITTTSQAVTGVWNTNPGTRGGFEFTEVCGKLYVADQFLHDTYTNLVNQTPAQADMSMIDPVTGVMTIYYNVFATTTRAYRSVYTPI
ncbi:MAG: hypothetical protein RL494_951 [Bacteroidota bacterium]|jgi:hypothetical protein